MLVDALIFLLVGRLYAAGIKRRFARDSDTIPGMNYELIIFDMDGTLVQSEDCASQAMIDVIPALTGSAQEVTARYRGMRLADIFDDIEKRIPGSIPDDCLTLYRDRENYLSGSMITPSKGAEILLSRITTAKCIASNAPVEKTVRSLEICGLSKYFPSGIFSAYQVQAWKPDPKLFEHAASHYKIKPADCLVVEDSEVGIQAAKAAGMDHVFYDPHTLAEVTDDLNSIGELTEILDILN